MDETVAAPPAARAVGRVRGEKALAFLEDVTSQAVADLAPGRAATACVLDATAHVLAELRVIPLADGSALLDGEPACREALAGLARIAPLSGCEVADESDAWRMVAVRGAGAADAVSGPFAEHAVIERDGVVLAGVAWGGPGLDALVPEGASFDPGVAPASHADLEAARIAAGRPRYGVDVTADLIVNETPLLSRAVSFTKGCYPGQESVAKIFNLGRVRRRVAGLSGTGAAPAAGDAIERDGAEVGRVTSAAATHQGWAAIGVVRTEVAAGDEVIAGGRAAAVHELE